MLVFKGYLDEAGSLKVTAFLIIWSCRCGHTESDSSAVPSLRVL